MLAIRGAVVPSTLEKISLVGTFDDGTSVEGETNITSRETAVRSVRLNPEMCCLRTVAESCVRYASQYSQ